LSSRTRRDGWPKDEGGEGFQRDILIIIIVIMGLVSLLGTGTMTLSLGLTRSSWWIGTTTTTRGLRASSPYPLPLSERNVIFIRSFANHLLAGTTHLED
jgi:hypothetical protein